MQNTGYITKEGKLQLNGFEEMKATLVGIGRGYLAYHTASGEYWNNSGRVACPASIHVIKINTLAFNDERDRWEFECPTFSTALFFHPQKAKALPEAMQNLPYGDAVMEWVHAHGGLVQKSKHVLPESAPAPVEQEDEEDDAAKDWEPDVSADDFQPVLITYVMVSDGSNAVHYAHSLARSVETFMAECQQFDGETYFIVNVQPVTRGFYDIWEGKLKGE